MNYAARLILQTIFCFKLRYIKLLISTTLNEVCDKKDKLQVNLTEDYVLFVSLLKEVKDNFTFKLKFKSRYLISR
jgi:hypothetical protein